MVSSITGNFFKSEEAKLLEKNLKIARKSASEIEARVSSSLKATEKVLSKIENIKSQKELAAEIEKINKLSNIRKDLKNKNVEISKEEADTLLNAYQSFNNIIQENEDIREALEKQGEDLEKLDITLPLKKASEKLGEDFGQFFSSNISAISQGGLAQSGANLALSSISPELGFVTELLGVDFGGIASTISGKLFGSKEKEDTDLEKLETSINNLSELEKTIHEDNSSLNDDHTQDIVDAIEEQTQVYKTLADDKVQAESIRNEENLVIAEEQHNELIEINDDIRDGQNKNSMFSKFFGKGGFLGKTLSKLAKPLTALGALLGKKGLLGKLAGAGSKAGSMLGKGAMAGGKLALGAGAVGVAGLVGYGIGTWINENLLSDDVKLAIGDFIGPKIDSIVEFFKGIPSWFKEKFDQIVNFDYVGSFNSIVASIGTSLSNGFTSLKDFFTSPLEKIKEWLGIPEDSQILSSIGNIISSGFSSYLEFWKSPLSTIQGWFDIDPNTGILDTILEIVLSPFKDIGDFLDNPTGKIKEFFGNLLNEDEETELKLQNLKQEYGDDIVLGEPSILGFIKHQAKALIEKEPEAIDLGMNSSMASANELENEIAQLQLSTTVNNAARSQEVNQNKQTKELIKTLQTQKEKEKQNSRYQGLRSQDNSPVVSNDIGLIMTLGGGL